MLKRIISRDNQGVLPADEQWLEVEHLARVELTSEDPEHPFEWALRPDNSTVWKASSPGKQVIRLLFFEPLRISHIRLEFHEERQPRTQEFVLRWLEDEGRPYQEIVRQQYNFSPPDTTREVEDYTVHLDRVKVLELSIEPDINGSDVRASLAGLLLA